MTNTLLSIIVAAIFVVEGGDRAKVPYGILAVKVRNKAEAKKVCETTVLNNWARWTEEGRPGCFLRYLGDRYCPPDTDPVGNRRWKKNIIKALHHHTCNCAKLPDRPPANAFGPERPVRDARSPNGNAREIRTRSSR